MMKNQFLLSIVTALGLTLSGCGGGGGTAPTGSTPDPTLPSFSVSTATVIEGNTGTTTIDFTVTLSEVLTEAITVDYYTSDGSASAGTDYTAIPATTVVIPAGSTTATVSLTVAGDTLFETDETVNLHVSSSSHPDVGAATAIGTITNDDTAPSLSIAGAAVTEGNVGTTNLALAVTLSAVSGAETTVDYVTANGTASAGSDYNVITAATLTIPAGSTTGTVNIAVFGDTTFETDETMTVILSNPVNATLGTATATGTITNDDVIPSLSIAAASVAEGNAGTTNLDFTVSLSAASSQNISVGYTTANGTATAGSDYTAITTTTLNIPAGSTTGTITVAVSGDATFEADETMTVTLSNVVNATIATAAATGTITNDDTAPSLSMVNVSVVEGNAGPTNLVFTVTQSAVSGINTSVDYTTSNGTATAGSDYTATTTTTLTIPAGATTGAITVIVSGDTLFEADETMAVTLSNPTNATIGTATATGTMSNDDTAPSVSIANVSVVEGNAGTTDMIFTITLNAVSGVDATVDITSSDGTATAGSDYTAASGTINFPAGLTTRTVTVLISGDTLFEPDETLISTLSNPSNATIGTATATGTITNDDVTPVAMTISGRSLDFTWGVDSFTGITQANINHYRILVNPDGVSGFTVVPTASNIATLNHSIEVPVHKTNWTSAQYLVEACNLAETTCGTSANQTLALIDSIAATVYVKASNTGAFDNFAWSVAISGDGNTLAVSATGEDSVATGVGGNQADSAASAAGAVYVFTKTGTTWSQQAYVKASNTDGNDKFGQSLSLSNDGNTLAVGANWEDSVATGIGGNQADNTAGLSGAVYVFFRSAIGWSQQAYIKASNTSAGDEFGNAVSLSDDGNTLAVSAVFEDSSATGIGGNQGNFVVGTDSGAVYLFGRVGTVWSQQAYVKASNTNAADQFGYTVSLSGNGTTLAVGAKFEDSVATGIGGNQADNTATNSGAVYVFINNGAAWVQQAYLKASNNQIFEKYGWSVSLSSDGNTLAVGATGEDSVATGVGSNQADNTASASGAVYVYARTAGTTWSQQAYVKASNTEAADEFGHTVALSGDGNTLAVGTIVEASSATGIDGSQVDNTTSASGAVYVFTRSGLTWLQKSYVKASNTGAGDTFGDAVSLSSDGNTLAVGASNEDSAATGIGGNQADNISTNSGAVYLY